MDGIPSEEDQVLLRINIAGYGWGIKGSLGADNAVSVPELVGLPCAVALISAAPLTKNINKVLDRPHLSRVC